jgi:peptidyl-prolyl cis-trans isomerase C
MRRALAAAAGIAAWWVALSAYGDTPAEVVVRVGAAQLTVADVERRLAMLPPFQLQRYGSTPDEIRRRYVNEVLVPELLYSEQARGEKIENQPEVWDRVREILRQALENDLREQILKKEPITQAEIKAYFDAHRDRFETPRRLRLWRILVSDEALAKKIAEAAKGTDGPKRWSDLAREHSLDKTSAMRNGDLGFVRPDGRTDTPRTQVPAALFEAADKVKDGELVPQPIPVDGGFAVVWRRGSLPAVNRTLEQEQRSIQQILSRQKLEAKRAALIDELRKQHVKEVNDALLQYVQPNAFGDFAARQRPGVMPRHKREPIAPSVR